MKNRALVLGWLIYGTVGCVLPGFGADAGQRPRSVLQGVAALEKPVAYSETKIALGELVQKVAEDTGVPLTAARDVADEPVAVVVREFPARELLEQLAELLDYQWSRRGAEAAPRYEIWQDLTSKQREEALRQGAFADVEMRFRQEVRRVVEMAALSQEQIEDLLNAAEQRRQEWQKLTPEQRQLLLSSPEEKERSRCFSAAGRLWSPIPRALASLLGRLSPPQWALLRQEGKITFSTDPQPGELPLPSEMGRIFRASPVSIYRPQARPVFEPAVEEQMRDRERELQEQWAAATGYAVTIRLDAYRFGTEGVLFLNTHPTPLRSDAPTESAFLVGGTDMMLSLYAGPRDFQQQAVEETPQRRAELAEDPIFGARKIFQPEAKPRRDPLGPGSGSAWRLQEVLPDLARTYGVPFISDAYSNAATIPAGSFSATEPTALFTLLDRLVGPTHHWDRRGNLVRLRSRTWFLDRPREVPLRLVRRWKELCDQHGALPLKEYLEMVATLNDGQLQSLDNLVWEAGLPSDIPRVHSARQALRLYTLLAPVQRQALWQGKALPVAQMTPAQRDLVVATVQERNRYRPTPLNLAQWAAGRVSLTSEPFVRITKQRGASTHHPRRPTTTPHGGPGEALPRTPGSGLAPAPVPTPDSVTCHAVTQVAFHFQCGPAMGETVFLTVASPP